MTAPDPDLTTLPEDLLVGLLRRAEVTLAMVEPLRWKCDEGIYAWLEARSLVRRFSAELQRRIAADLDALLAASLEPDDGV